MKKGYDSTEIYRKTQKKGASQTYDTPSNDGIYKVKTSLGNFMVNARKGTITKK